MLQAIAVPRLRRAVRSVVRAAGLALAGFALTTAGCASARLAGDDLTEGPRAPGAGVRYQLEGRDRSGPSIEHAIDRYIERPQSRASRRAA